MDATEDLVKRLPEAVRHVAENLGQYSDKYDQLMILGDIAIRRYAQDQQYGVNHWSWTAWMALAGEEIGEALKHAIALDLNPDMSKEHRDNTRVLLRSELVDAAAVLVAMIEDLDSEEAYERGYTGFSGPDYGSEHQPADGIGRTDNPG